MRIRWIEEADSTNNYLKLHPKEVGAMEMVAARRQTAGRGQRGNSWESEPDRNLTFSFRFAPEGVSPAGQFAISEAVALAIAAALADHGIEAKVKWPNDIYAGDMKICGILIENSIMGATITDSIVGIGLNVNQTEFLSDAPNPVSMSLLAGTEFNLEEVARTVAARLEEYVGRIAEGEALHRQYMERLWRGDGKPYPFREPGNAERFMAAIEGVEPQGFLLLRKEEGTICRYAFKEIEFVR